MEIGNFVRDEIKNMKPYEPGKSIDYVKKKYGITRVIKLASNENPYGPSPLVSEVFKKIDIKELSRYPETFPSELLEAIEEHTEWPSERVVVGAGMDGVMETIFRLLIDKGDRVILPIPTYQYYHTLINISGAKGIFIERKEDWRIDAEKIIEVAEKEKPKLIFICSPNNPTAAAENKEDVKAIVESCDTLVFIDEAYGEYADFDGISLKNFFEYDNVIIGRTMSKAFGLANLRVGYAVLNEELKKEYLKATTPFPVSTISALVASTALRDRNHLNFVLKNNLSERERLKVKLSKWLKVFPSNSNFLFVRVDGQSKTFTEELMKRGIIIRDCSSFYGCGYNYVRITVGKKEENDVLISALESIFER